MSEPSPSLRKYYHTAFKHTYEERPDGLVQVTAEDGSTGVFHVDGRWVEGDLTQANLHMLIWCGGPRLPDDFQYHWMESPYDRSRPSGWPEKYETLLTHQFSGPPRTDKS